MKRNKIAYSSREYLLFIEDLEKLPKAENYYAGGDKVIIMLGDVPSGTKDSLLCGEELLNKAKENGEKYVLTTITYYTFNPFISFFIQCIKYFKRRAPVQGTNWYRTKLSHLLTLDITRGIRTRENAYQWNNPRWYMSEEERIKRYDKLYNSMKTKSYNFKLPMRIGLNRHMGWKDQLLQGHHRIGICQELNIDDVSVEFWAYPKSPRLFY